jgi:prophage tail gpP-like protein
MSINPGSLTDQSKITLQIGSERLSGFSGLQVSLGIDTASNAYAFSIPWTSTPENIKRFKAFNPKEVKIHIDNKLILTGYLEVSGWNISEGQNVLTIQGRSASAPIVDYSAGPPFQFQNITFNDFGREMWRAVGGDVTKTTETFNEYVDGEGIVSRSIESINGGAVAIAKPDTGKISEISITPGQSLYEVLSQLASANGLWAIPTPRGQLGYTKLDSKAEPVATLIEGQGPVRSVTSTADITKRFQKYMVVGAFEGNPEATAEVDDPETFGLAKRGRKIAPLNQQSTDMEQAAKFLRSTALIDSYTASCEVDGWHYNGNLWQPGKIITLLAPGAYINFPSRFMIKNVTLQLDESGGQITGLDLAIPEAYDGAEINAGTEEKGGTLPWRSLR